MSLQINSRNRQSKFSNVIVTNFISGFFLSLDKDDNPESYKINFLTTVKGGSKTNYRTALKTFSVEDGEKIVSALKLNDSNSVTGENGYTKPVDENGDFTPIKQACLYGIETEFGKFSATNEVRVYTDIFAGIGNAVYESAKTGQTVKNEAVTEKGIRCFSHESGEKQPIYVENFAAFMSDKDRHGKNVCDVSIIDALAAMNAIEEGWSYDKDQYINPIELAAFYKENDINHDFLLQKIADNVFKGIEGTSLTQFDYTSFDVESLGSVADAKLFVLEHVEKLGTIAPTNLSTLPKAKAAIKAAITKYLTDSPF